MTERNKIWARRVADDPTNLLAFNAPPDEVEGARSAAGTPSVDRPAMDGLYVSLSETDIPAVVQALQSGVTTGLPPWLAGEVSAAYKQGLFSKVLVPGHDGAMLDGGLWLHRDGQRRPAIVMPSPWTTQGWLVYAIQSLKFATKGYNVLAYSARGFGNSSGEVDVAAEADVIDGSKALDFLIDQAKVEPTKVGFLGDSYGSGISQLVAARDRRVNAVVAMSTWGDLGKAFYENSTRHIASVQTLLLAAADAKLSDGTKQVFANVLAGDKINEILEWARPRSPLTVVDDLNARRVPIFFAHAWHETLFPTNQTLEMFNRLEGPKRLDLSIGDHSGPELTGMLGLPNRIWGDAHRWFDHFLRGEVNHIETEGQVVSQVMWKWLAPLETKPSWKEVTREVQRLHLAGPSSAEGDGGLTDAPSTGWSMAFKTGVRTAAEVADKVVISGFPEMLGKPRAYATATISRSNAIVCSTARIEGGIRLRGIPRLHVTFRSVRGGTFIAYLFDADADGNAKIITHAPFTAPDGSDGKALAVTIELQATGYDVAAGRRLMLVLDGLDAFYSDGNGVEPNTITISSPAGDPSYLELPIG